MANERFYILEYDENDIPTATVQDEDGNILETMVVDEPRPSSITPKDPSERTIPLASINSPEIDTIMTGGYYSVECLAVWQAQVGPDGTLIGDGRTDGDPHGGGSTGGGGGGDITGGGDRGSGPLDRDMSYWVRVKTTRPATYRRCTDTYAYHKMKEAENESLAHAQGYTTYDAFDYTRNTNKTLLRTTITQGSGNFNWGSGTNNGSIPVQYSIINGGLPFQGAGGTVSMHEWFSAFPGHSGLLTGGGSYWCPGRSGVRFTSSHPAPQRDGISKTPNIKKGPLGGPNLDGRGTLTEQVSPLSTTPAKWSDINGRGFLNCYQEASNPLIRDFFRPLAQGAITSYIELRDYGRDIYGKDRIHIANYNMDYGQGFHAVFGLIADQMVGSTSYNGTGTTPFGNELASDSIMDTTGRRLVDGRPPLAHSTNPANHATKAVARTMNPGEIANDWGDPWGPNSLRDPRARNPYAYPANGIDIYRWDRSTSPYTRVYYKSLPQGAEPTKYHEAVLLRGKGLQEVSTSKALRLAFLEWMETCLGTRTGLFNPAIQGNETMAMNVAQTFRTDQHKMWLLNEVEPGANVYSEVHNDPAYSNLQFGWAPD